MPNKISVITASFNAGSKLKHTVLNALMQTASDYNIIVKDAGSTDGSVEALKAEEKAARAMEEGRLRILVKEDKNVYDGMNQAIEEADGEYLLFLNCGDIFHRKDVLEQAKKQMQKKGTIYYGDTFCKRTKNVVKSAPEITGFTCYRNIPCHQSCFYARELFQNKKYDRDLLIRADYDHFLWCYYKAGVRPRYMNLIIADYEGGGISEQEENRERDKEEHKIVVERYMAPAELFRYRLYMALTLAPLRRKIAEDSRFSGVYHRMKTLLYGGKQ